MRSPATRRHLRIEKLELEHASCCAADEQALRKRRRAADLRDKLGLNAPKEFPLAAAAV
jgi:hypothetical protein